MAATYPRAAENLLARCRAYRRGEEELDVLKAEVWAAASQISIPEERPLREFLQQAEGRLDMIQFTVDQANVRQASLEIVDAIEARLVSYVAGEDAGTTR